MPFTPAHPAIVLPLLKVRYLSATGLIIGSMTPDFEYFLKFSVSSKHSHTLMGLLYFDLPLGIFLSILFHQIVKSNLIYNLPLFLKQRFLDDLGFDFLAYLKQHWFLFGLSVLIGSGSHILWDAFTHGNGYFAKELPFYKGTYIPFNGIRYPLFYVLQHTSTVVGLVAISLTVMLRSKSIESVNQSTSGLYWLLLVVITVAAVFIRFQIHAADYNIGNVVVSSISGLCIALLITGVLRFNNPGANNGKEVAVGIDRKTQG